MFPPECSENVERVGMQLSHGLRALLSTMLPPERSENVEWAGMWVRCGLRALLPTMLPPEFLKKVKRVELRALFLSSARSERLENFERSGL